MQTEIWRDIKGYKGLYQISNLGRVKSLQRINYQNYDQVIPERIKTIRTNEFGYKNISLWKDGIEKCTKVHRLVAIAFIPNPENKAEVNHKNSDKNDNRVENLEWMTRSENLTHSYREGTRVHWSTGKKGKDSPSSKSVVQMDMDGNFVAEFDSARDAASATGFRSISISRVCRGERNKHQNFKWIYK